MKDKEMMLEATDIIRTVAGKQKGYKRFLGNVLNKLAYKYYKTIGGNVNE